MRLILSFLAIALFSATVFGNISADNRYLLNHDDAVTQKAQLGTLLHRTRNLLVGKYSYAVQGGSTTVAAGSKDFNLLEDLTDKTSLAKLPSKAVVTNVWVDVLTSLASNQAATMSIGIVTPADLLAARGKANFVTSSEFIQGIPAGATTAFIKLGTFAASSGAPLGESTVHVRLNTWDLSAGKFNVYIEYVLGD